LPEGKKDIYFGANLVELKETSFDQKEFFHKKSDLTKIDLYEFGHLECKNCQNSSIVLQSQKAHEINECGCEIILFDLSKYSLRLKRSNLVAIASLKIATNYHESLSANAACSQSNLFSTQLDSDFYFSPYFKGADCQTTNISQLIKLDSILDSLENIGYYGYATFRGIIQRVGFVDWANMNIYTTQRTQTQSFQSQYLRQEHSVC
jgi:hypothetical protein